MPVKDSREGTPRCAVFTAGAFIFGMSLITVSPAARASPSLAWRRVSGTVDHEVTEIVSVRTGSGTVETTADHPFYVLSRGWVPAGELRAGMKLMSHGDLRALVMATDRHEGRRTPVYNLTVEHDHTYYAGTAKMLVHNGGPLCSAQTASPLPLRGWPSRAPASARRGRLITRASPAEVRPFFPPRSLPVAPLAHEAAGSSARSFFHDGARFEVPIVTAPALRGERSIGGEIVAVKPGEIANPNYYHWDNWFVHYKDQYYRFALQAPREFPKNFKPTFAEDFARPKGYNYEGTKVSLDERHQLAEVGLYTSKDGTGWKYQGVAIGKDPGNGWDSHVVWSGNAHVIDGKLVVPYTGRSKVLDPLTNDRWTQRIGMTVYDDESHKFTKLGMVLDPLRRDAKGELISKKLGYDISSTRDVPMAWRDPYLLKDKSTGELHMFFAAKIDEKTLAERLPETKANGAIGHAIARPGSLTEWELQPPLRLPAAYSQFELPIVIQKNNKNVLFSSVVELGPEGRRQSVRAYQSASLEGAWQPINGSSDKIMDMNRIYGLNLAKGANGKDYYGVSFYDNDKLTLSPLVKMGWDKNGVPTFPHDSEW